VTRRPGLSEADSREGICSFLGRNSGLSLVARGTKGLLGTVLCGHDGRRGYLHHLAVVPSFRGRGIGRALVETCLTQLAALGIQKCHIFLRADNRDGEHFWCKLGWQGWGDLSMMSKETPRAVGTPGRKRTGPPQAKAYARPGGERIEEEGSRRFGANGFRPEWVTRPLEASSTHPIDQAPLPEQSIERKSL
jgi:putative acetyltransferase